MKTFRQIFKLSSTSPQVQTSLPPPSHPSYTMNTNTSTTSTSTSPLTVIELFQSQGCNSCPPANSFLLSNFPSHDPKHLFLTYEVTYWDHLGWRDTFGDKRWDARQRDYAAVLRQRSVYTPQVIVDGGMRPLGGSGWRDLAAVLAVPSSTNLNMLLVSGENVRSKIRIEGRERSEKGGDVLVVFYEAQPDDLKILSGENRGKILQHRNIVRDIQVIGKWRGPDGEFEVPDEREGMQMAVLVQVGRGGEIIGAMRV